jgi:hypothetical protein
MYAYLTKDINGSTNILRNPKKIFNALKNNTIHKIKTTDLMPVGHRLLVKYVINKIRVIERDNAHPDLLNTFLYYLDIFNFSTALKMMDIYFSQIYEIFQFKTPESQEIKTVLEKSLVHHGYFDDFNTDYNEDDRVYNMYTIVPNTQNTYQNAVNQLNQMISQLDKPYNAKVGEFITRIKQDKGNLSV